ncbi:MAG: hypothetical protein KJZ87_17945 [Thermoguttaceae bacterium]|nr:hypothetical protein [Thermoguttaceae bacterium]
MYPLRTLLLASTATCLILGSAAWAKEPKAKKEAKEDQPQYVRLVRDDSKQPVALEVAIVRFAPMDCSKDCPTVDLVGAVHVADKGYFAELNKLFEGYEAVLYELVAPEGSEVPQPGAARGSHPISVLQTAMTGVLDLEYQLEAIDYSRDNMVHADMSPEAFAATMKKRGESFMQVFMRAFGYAMSKQSSQASGPSDAQLLIALFSKDRSLALKRIMAEQFQDLESSMAALDGPQGSTLIGERNKVALGVLRKQLDDGKKNLAIFYGAGHMADFAQRLRDDFGLTPINTRWLTAWDLKGQKGPQ